MRPLFSQTSLFRELKEIVKKDLNCSDFEQKWQMIVEAFSLWESSEPARNTSDLNVRLEFLERVCAAFPAAKLNTRQPVVKLILSDSGARTTGDTLNGRQPNGAMGTLKVVRQEITDRFGVLYTLEAQDGSRFTREFFD